MRSQLSAIYISAVSLIGQTLGPTVVALCTDYVFKNELRVNDSLALTTLIFVPASGALLFWGRRSFLRSLEPVEQPSLMDPISPEIRALTALELGVLTARAAALRDRYHGRLQSFSPKVFIPLTHLCRDVCHYCTFAHPPKRGETGYMSLEAVLEVARAGAALGCTEALFTLVDKPELRYRAAREELTRLGHETTLSYVAEAAQLVLNETGLLPHINAGVMGTDDIALLRRVSVSQGLMLETASERLSLKRGPHYGSPDKDPALRLETIRLAGEQRVPFACGIADTRLRIKTYLRSVLCVLNRCV